MKSTVELHYPAAGVEGVSVALIIDWDKVHDKHVVLHGVEPAQPHLVRRKHSPAAHFILKAQKNVRICLPARLCDDHLCTQFVELLPERLHLQLAVGGGQPVMQRLL